MPYHVLFVCLGNICRSPMAEAVLRHLVAKAGLEQKIAIDSAGTGDWHIGKPPHEGTRKQLDRHRIPYEGMRARRLGEDDGLKFDLIVAMDSRNEQDIRERLKGKIKSGGCLIRFMSLLPERAETDVPDPYYSGNFEEVYELVKEGCDKLLKRIEEELTDGRNDRNAG